MTSLCKGIYNYESVGFMKEGHILINRVEGSGAGMSFFYFHVMRALIFI